MALDQLSEYIYIKDTLENEINNSLSSGRAAYNFSVDEILQEFLGSLYGWGNFNTVVLMTLYIPTFALALCGNILVIITVTGRKALRQVRHYYLVNLALADLTITLLCMPTSVGSIIHRLWIYGHFLCKVATFLQGKYEILIFIVHHSCDYLSRCTFQYISLNRPARMWVELRFLCCEIQVQSWAEPDQALSIRG